MMVAAVCLILAVVAAETGFEQWKKDYSKSYSSFAEEAARQKIWEENAAYLTERNRYEKYALFAPDHWTDRTLSEFLAQNAHCASSDFTSSSVAAPPLLEKPPIMSAEQYQSHLQTKTLDWRTYGAVSKVKDQGAFGVCWSFGATGVLEGISVIFGRNRLQELSEQELIDCCHACQGRSPDISWDYLINNTKGQIATEKSYPYKGNVSSCQLKNKTTVLSDAHVSSWYLTQQAQDGNQDDIAAQVISAGPSNIGVDATCLFGYKSGIITNCTGKGVDHATLIVGLASEYLVDGSTIPFWVVKNSWGPDFGEGGYYRFERNTNQLAMDAAFFARF